MNKWHERLVKKRLARKAASQTGAVEQTLSLLKIKNTAKIIHVTGTNGKGTVCHMLESVLRAAGYKTGLFTSPHLITPLERIRVNGKNISEKDFVSYTKKVVALEKQPLNYFTVLLLAAAKYFDDKKCDYIILEAGIGGLWDSTNIFNSVLSVITSVSMDHADILGGTIEAIAKEKAGIIKKGMPCVCGPLVPAARKIVKAQARKKNAAVYFTGSRSTGAEQINSAVAAKCVELLGIGKKYILPGIKKAQISARFEVIKKGKKTFIVDGAHNEEAARVFAQRYKKLPFYGKAPLVFTIMQDKDYKKVLSVLSPHFTEFVFYKNGERGRNVTDMLEAVAPLKNKKAYLAADFADAFKYVRKNSETAFAGSFYQAGEVLKKLKVKPR